MAGVNMTDDLANRVAARYASRKLQLGPARLEARATEQLRKMTKFPAKNRGDRQSATLSAAHYARKQGQTMYLYEGNSFMHVVWRVSFKPSEYLDPINNIGAVVYSVSPDLKVQAYDVMRPS